MKNSEVNNKHKDRYVKLETILSIWCFKRKLFPYGRIMKHTYRLCAHGGMPKWGVGYWGTYAPVVNWIIVRSLLSITRIHES